MCKHGGSWLIGVCDTPVQSEPGACRSNQQLGSPSLPRDRNPSAQLERIGQMRPACGTVECRQKICPYHAATSPPLVASARGNPQLPSASLLHQRDGQSSLSETSKQHADVVDKPSNRYLSTLTASWCGKLDCASGPRITSPGGSAGLSRSEVVHSVRKPAYRLCLQGVSANLARKLQPYAAPPRHHRQPIHEPGFEFAPVSSASG